MRCAIYARYSSDLQKESSPEDQTRNCKQFAKSKGWSVLENHIYADRAVSGSSLHGRLQLTRLLDVATTSPAPFDYVLVDDTSRLSRDKVDQMNIIADFHDAGVYLYFVSQNIDTADEQTNDILIPIHGIFDSLYLKELAKKTQRGMAGQVLKGYNPGGRTYGYSYEPVPDPSGAIDKKTREVRKLGTAVSINEEQADIVRWIFNLYSSGIGLREIVNLLNQERIEPPGSANQRAKFKIDPSWCPSAVRYILQNPKYIGDWTWNKHKWYKNRRTGKRAYRLRPESEWVKHNNPELSIMSEELFEQVQQRFTENILRYKKGARGHRKSCLFSGMLKCSVCGASFIAVGQSKSSDSNYACSINWHRGNTVCSNNIRVKRSVLEKCLLSALQEQILQPEIIDKAVRLANQRLKSFVLETSKQIPKLARQITKLQDEIDNLVAFVAKTGDCSPAVQTTLSDKERELQILKDKIERAPKSESRKSLKVDPDFVRRKFNNLSELLSTDITRARAELMKITEKIELTPMIDGKRRYLRAVGQSKLDGILGFAENSSTRCFSGGRI